MLYNIKEGFFNYDQDYSGLQINPNSYNLQNQYVFYNKIFTFCDKNSTILKAKVNSSNNKIVILIENNKKERIINIYELKTENFIHKTKINLL
jgi:hypothetical protein